MNNQNYLPTADMERSAWLKSFASKLPEYSHLLEITEDEITSLTKDASMFSYLVSLVETYKNEIKKRVALKNVMAYSETSPYFIIPSAPRNHGSPEAVMPGIFRRLIRMITLIKNHPLYNETIGRDLGIAGEELLLDIHKMKPYIKFTLDSGKPVIQWTKVNAQSVDIYVQRVPLSPYVFLANVTQEEYIDTHLLPMSPTLWSYRAIYKIGDDQVGQVSNTVSVPVLKYVSVGVNY